MRNIATGAIVAEGVRAQQRRDAHISFAKTGVKQ